MRTTVKTRFGLTVTGLAVLAVALAPRQATADCAMGAHCSTDYCEISCDSEADYIVFGTWTEGANVKTGVCWWDNSGWSKGMYGGRIGTTTDAADWRIFAGGGSDLVRLADRTAATEACGTYGGSTLYIDGDIETGDTFMEWGDAGNDWLLLCDTTGVPASGNCIWGGRADGRADSDYVYGSTNDDELWGGDGNDYLYGFEGEDTLHGGAGNDSLYGDDNCDDIYGDDGTDYCDCSATSNDVNEGWYLTGHGCETDDGKCQDCLLLFGAECPLPVYEPTHAENADGGSGGPDGGTSGSP
jgi:Ca2+-binding RTX toxin-like protein